DLAVERAYAARGGQHAYGQSSGGYAAGAVESDQSLAVLRNRRGKAGGASGIRQSERLRSGRGPVLRRGKRQRAWSYGDVHVGRDRHLNRNREFAAGFRQCGRGDHNVTGVDAGIESGRLEEHVQVLGRVPAAADEQPTTARVGSGGDRE